MKRLLGFAVALLISTNALAQSVQQSGPITPNTAAIWSGTGIIKGGVTATDSPLTTFGVTRDAADGICVSSARSTAAGRNQLCFQAATSGPAKISLLNSGTAAPQSLNFVINGTTFSFPGALAGITINSTPVIGGVNGNCLSISSGNVNQVPCTILTAGTTGSGPVVLQNSPTLSGTIGGGLTFSGNETFSGNVTMGSQLIVNGVSTPASASGITAVMGTISAPTLTNTGQAWLFNTGVGGAILQGDGSSQDITLLNKGGTPVMQVATGTTGITFPGVLTLSGLSSGTCAASVVLNSSNQTVTGSCPGAASTIQVGTTSILTGTTANLLFNNAGTLGNETIASILTAGTGISISGTTNATIALTTPVSATNGGTGASSPAAHTVAIGEGSSAFAAVGPGTTGQALVSQGASADPAYKSGVPVLLNTLTASSSANLQDTSSITATYNEYEIVFENLVTSTSNSGLILLVHSGGTFQTTNYVNSTGTVANGAFAGTAADVTSLEIGGFSQNTTVPGLSGTIRVYTPALTAGPKFWVGVVSYNNTSSGITSVTVSGIWNGGNGAIDGFELCYSTTSPTCTGTITSGVAKIYGIL